jgi:NUMOD3 motif
MYYVYSYLREDYSPYYIGKGSGKRAYTKGPKEVKPPRDKSRVKIIKADLTEEEAFLLEKLYILMFGRVDLGTGILRNKSDGGDGSSGRIASPEERKKRSEMMKGVKRPQWIYDKIAASNRGKKVSAETRAKQSAARKGKKCTEEHKRKVSEAKKGFKHTEEAKQKMSVGHMKKAKPHKIIFSDGREIIVDSIMEWCRNNPYSSSPVYKVKNKSIPHKDIVKVEPAN